jgi:hypothetical protein
MSIELDVHDDFAAILDGAEAITIERRDTADAIAVSKAWRFSSDTAEAISGIQDVARNDVVWQFAWNDAVAQPRIGDYIVDAAATKWTILSISELGAKTRLRCAARNLSFVHALLDRVTIQQATVDGSGVIISWTDLETNVPARIQPDRNVLVLSKDEPPTTSELYRVVLGVQTPLTHLNRIVGSDSTTYDFVEYTQADRIDTLPVAQVKKSS